MATQTKSSNTDKTVKAVPTVDVAALLAAQHDIWHPKTVEQLAAEQGVKPMTDWNQFFGSARDLWESDEDFEEFLKAATGRSSERA